MTKHDLIGYENSELIPLKSQLFEQFGIKVVLKPEYRNHPYVSGNKWWKLKYNLEAALQLGHKKLLTFGGAYSNHVYSTAVAAREIGLKSIGIIRGEETLPLNKTLSVVKEHGMEIHYVSREAYRRKDDLEFVIRLHNQFGDFYLLPEGGTNELAIKGCAEFALRLNEETEFDYVCLPVGTGGTMAGIIEGSDPTKQIIGFPVLKGASFLEGDIKRFTARDGNWQLLYDYHFGGYAKATAELQRFHKQFENDFGIPLDPVYTSKMMFGIFNLVKKGFFKRGSTILILHTGGLQGFNS